MFAQRHLYMRKISQSSVFFSTVPCQELPRSGHYYYLVQRKGECFGNSHGTNRGSRTIVNVHVHYILPQCLQADLLILQSQPGEDEVIGLLELQDVAAGTQENGGDHECVVCHGETNPFAKQLGFVVSGVVEEAAVPGGQGDDYVDICNHSQVS
jgi:hypothetical protein